MANTHSADFDSSSSQYLSITDAAQTGLGITGDITIEAWVKMESLPGTNQSMIIASKRSVAAGCSYQLQIFNNNDTGCFLSFVWTTTGSDFGSQGKEISISTGTWTHLAISFDVNTGSGYSIEFFQNGSSLGAITFGSPTSLYDSAAAFEIGRVNVSGQYGYIDGLIDNLAVFNGLRSEATIQADMWREWTGSETNAQGVWTMEDNFLDLTSNNNDLTNNNSVTFSTDIPASTSIKTVMGLAKASVKTVDGLAIASVKSVMGLE